ncbi:anhydro-N-acetylmuramic acid kinase [Ideonella sp. BN130291]|uniref:anhydro-N-acetylmuramic acid kinase n=1 Tax=Ideonella sp. BN130291 TaxID=3112940 RepID=UPI002E262FC5|nr:anhydro-N-acetylmuramic acid kinase [Ideonella sp. BN130291]
MPLYIGLMSGTSLDGADAVLADIGEHGLRVLAHGYEAFDAPLRAELLALNRPGDNELHRAALAANRLVQAYTRVVQTVLRDGDTPATAVRAIGAHGQTVRHRPGDFDGLGYTLQINNGALLAECTGIDVVCDFRSRDVAAGGQGAPLVPAFHAAMFARAGEAVAVLNLGGISNLSLIDPIGSVRGFDCGPANALLDGWCEQHTGQPYDDGGRWAASGQVLVPLLAALLSEPYLHKPPPKSTGRDLFNLAWLAPFLAAHAAGAAPQDVQATLAEFSACAVADDLTRHGTGTAELLVCGGGAFNEDLLARLQHRLPDMQVHSTAVRGLPPMQVEAAAFAWLAHAFCEREPGNRVEATGARGPRVLGALYPR